MSEQNFFEELKAKVGNYVEPAVPRVDATEGQSQKHITHLKPAVPHSQLAPRGLASRTSTPA